MAWGHSHVATSMLPPFPSRSLCSAPLCLPVCPSVCSKFVSVELKWNCQRAFHEKELLRHSVSAMFAPVGNPVPSLFLTFKLQPPMIQNSSFVVVQKMGESFQIRLLTKKVAVVLLHQMKNHFTMLSNGAKLFSGLETS